MPQNTINLIKAAEMTGRCDVNGTATDERSEYPASQIVHTNGLVPSTGWSTRCAVCFVFVYGNCHLCERMDLEGNSVAAGRVSMPVVRV